MLYYSLLKLFQFYQLAIQIHVGKPLKDFASRELQKIIKKKTLMMDSCLIIEYTTSSENLVFFQQRIVNVFLVLVSK